MQSPPAIKKIRLTATAVVAVGVISLAIWSAVKLIDLAATARLDRELAELRAQGIPLQPAELAAGHPPPQENAAYWLSQAATDLDAISLAIINLPSDAILFGPIQKLTESDKQAMQAAFAARPNGVRLVEQAAATPDYVPVAPDIESDVHARAAMRVLHFRAMLQAAHGQYDDALRTALLMMALCRQFDSCRLAEVHDLSFVLRNVSCGTAAMVLQAGDVSPAMRDALEAELAGYDGVAALRASLRGLRVWGLSMFEREAQGRLPETPASWRLPGGYQNDVISFLDLIDEADTQADAPFWQETENAAPAVAGPGTTQLLSAVDSLASARATTEAHVRSLRVLNALQRHQRGTKTEVPKLAQLGLPTAATADPFFWEPLRFQKLSDGWLVYSVGENFIDDRGHISDGQDIGFGPP